MLTTHKIVFIGMDNAGKTSIINVLSQTFTEYEAITPTQRVERSQFNILGKELMIWDFGGQEKYRESYLQTPEKFFDQINILYFVVDVQDPEKYELSVDYFEKIHKALETFSPNAQIIILFHKNDPGAEPVIQKYNIEQYFYDSVKHLFDERIHHAMEDDEDPPVRTYQTTIKNPMSIVKAISEPLLGTSAMDETISDMLNVFIQAYKLKCAILFTKNHFELGQAISQEFNEKERDAIMHHFLRNIIPSLDFNLDMGFKDGISFKLFVEGFEISQKKFKVPFYLVTIYDPQKGFGEREKAFSQFEANVKSMISTMDLFDFYTKISP